MSFLTALCLSYIHSCLWLIPIFFGRCAFGCSPGTFGPSCENPCPANCAGDECDSTTGFCTAGCVPGYLGDSCTTACSSGTWGPACENTCGTNCLEDVCHHENGTCLQGCVTGYQGSKCDSVCTAGTWGDNCAETCEVGCNGGNCDPISGHCSSGCVLGYNGLSCDKKNDIALKAATLEVPVERETPMIILVQNYDVALSKVYIKFGSEEPCHLSYNPHQVLGGSPEIRHTFGIEYNITGFSHWFEVRHMFSLEATPVNVTLDNLGVINDHSITFNPHQHQIILDCYQNATIAETSTDILAPFQAERSIMTKYYIHWNLDDACLSSYGTISGQVYTYAWSVRYHRVDKCWLEGNTKVTITSWSGIQTWNPGLTLSLNFLPIGFYIINVRTNNELRIDGSKITFSRTINGYIEITKNRLKASMGPEVNSKHPYSQVLVLDASSSEDPEGTLTSSDFQFVWTCVMDDMLPCSIVDVTIGSDNVTIPHTGAIYALGSRSLKVNSNYTFEVTVSAAELRLDGKAQRHIFINNDVQPELEFICLSNCRNKLVPDSDWEVSLNQTQDQEFFHPWSDMHFEWQLYQGSQVILQQNNTGDTPLLVDNSLLDINTSYSIHVEFVIPVTDLNGSTDLLNVVTNDLPVIGSCDSSPTRGFHDTTKFTITCTGFYDNDSPLTYKLITNEIVLGEGSSGIFSDVTLPTGFSHTDYHSNITVQVTDTLNGTVSLSLLVQVYPSVAEYKKNINQPPVSTSGCEVSPQSGIALVTNFTVICSEFTDLDPPMTYSLYYKGQTESLLYKGNDMTTAPFYLSEGLEENNTASLVFKAKDVYKATTKIDISVQVLPFELDVLDFVQNTFISGDTEISGLTVQTIGTLGNVVNDDMTRNHTDQTDAAERLQLRTEIRESLTQSLLSVEIVPKFDEVSQVTQALDSLIKVKEEITEKQEELTVAVYGNLAEKLNDFENTDSSETRSTSENLLGSMGNLLTVIKDRGNVIKKINTTTSDKDTAESKKEQLEKVKKNTLQMISTVEKIVDILTDTITDEPVTVQTSVMSVRVQEMSADNSTEANVTLSVLADNSSIGLLLPPNHVLRQSLPEGDNSSVYTQIVVTKDNLYNWDQTAEKITSSVVDIVVKDQQLQAMTLTNMPDPVTVQFDVEGQDLKSDTLEFTYETNTGQVISSSILMISMTDIDPHMSLLVYIRAEKLNLTLMVYNSTEDETISPKTVQQDGIPILLNNSEGNADKVIMKGFQKLFFRIAVKEGQIIQGNQTDVPLITTNVSIGIGTYNTMCGYYNNLTEQWATDGCVISTPKDLKKMACVCNHLTAFAAGFIIVPNLVDPISDAALFLTFFDNPVVVMTVVIVWGLYLIMMVWARRKDRMDSMKGGVNVLEDNCAEDKYMYMVGLVTGWWRHAGTTANVYMYLCGDQGYSSKHLLSDGIARHFQSGAEDWFVLTTPKSLGKLQRIVIWHDNAGGSPEWFLKQIVIRDLQADKIWHFLYNDWLAVDRGVGQIKAMIQSLTQEDLVQNSLYQFGLKSSKDLKNNHLWISIISCPAYSPFTRIQRLSCALSLLLTTMLASLMFHGVPTDDPADQVNTGGITFSLSDIVIGIESGLIMFPVNFIIMQLFTRLNPRPSRWKSSQTNCPDEEDQPIKPHTSTSTGQSKSKDSSKSQPFRFPWWVVYIAWILVVSTTLISSYFVMLYGLMYGYQASIEWLVSFFTAFFQSAFVTEPLKVFLIAVLLAFIFKKPVEFEVLSQRGNMVLEQGEDSCQPELLRRQGITLSSIAPVKQATRPAMPRQTLQAIRQRLQLEERITTILREMVMYFTFVAIVLFIVHGHQDVATNYGSTKNTEDMFVYGKYTSVTLAEAKKVEDMWKYLQTTALPMLYSDTDRMANDVGYLIGTVRLRQKRIEKNSSCNRVNTHSFAELFPNMDCKVPFSTSDEEWGSFNESWHWPLSEADDTVSISWKYQSSLELKTIPFVGRLASYSGGGYVAELPHDTYHANITLNNLISHRWVDEYTRVIFLEFTSYNPNVDMLTVAVILFEQSNVGNMMTYHQFFSSKLNHYDTDLGKFVAACESLFLVYLIGFTYFEVKKFKRLRKVEYFSDTWSYFEIIIIALGYSTIGLFFQRLVIVDSVLTEYARNGPNKFTSFYTAVFWDFVLTYVLAALVMVVFLKVFKLFRFNTKTTILMQTMTIAKGNLLNFGLLFFICFLAFSLFANLAFGYWLEDYRDVGSSIITLTHFLVGVSDYDKLEEAHSLFGPVFFFMFAFIIQYILLSVFVAIILEAQSLSRKAGSNDVALTTFVCERFLLMIGFIQRSDYK